MLQLQVFVVVLVCLQAGSSSRGELTAASSSAEARLYVAPTEQYCINYRPCHTLSEYLGDQDRWFKSGTALHFLPGNHTVNSSISVAIKHIEDFSMTALSYSELASASAPPAQIQCSGLLEFCFMSVTNVSISGIIFKECGLKYPTALQNRSCHFPFQYAKTSNEYYSITALGLHNITGFVLKDVRILDSNGYGILAVDTQGETSMEGCEFHNNKWTGSRLAGVTGGNALFVFSKPFASFRISQCNFSNGINTDSAYYQSGSGGLGIILYQDDSKHRLYSTNVSISDCRFTNNTAVRGGNMYVAVYISRRYRAQHFLFLKNCTFSKGKASLNGGAVSIESVRSRKQRLRKQYFQELVLDVSECVFVYSTAKIGGALFFKSAVLKVYVSVKTSQFSHNRANIKGAGVYGMLDKDASVATVNITESRFMNNAASAGGAVYIESVRSNGQQNQYTQEVTLDVTDCVFVYNKAKEGGALFFKSALLKVYACIKTSQFSHNRANIKGAGIYGMLGKHVIAASVDITESRFINNTANKSGGGAVYIESVLQSEGQHDWYKYNQEVALDVTECVFAYNTAEEGGAVFFRSALLKVYASLKTSQFCHNRANNEGAGIYGMLGEDATAVTVNITDSRFINNTANTSAGGAVYIESVRSKGQRNLQYLEVALDVTECVFIYNSAKEGGALFFKSAFLKLFISIKTSQFYHNYANNEGAGIYGILGKNATVNIIGSRYVNNTAIKSGGGIKFKVHTNVNNITMDFTACNFTRNCAAIGSAISFFGLPMNDKEILDDVNIHLSYSNFTKNSALTTHYNSSVLDLHGSNFHLTTCNFINNNSTAVYANAAKLYLQGSIRIIGNRAASGGAFHMDCSARGQSKLLFNDVHLNISRNTAEQYGGGLFLSEHCSIYPDCFFDFKGKHKQVITMSGNRAKIAGDSIYGGSLESCVFKNISGPKVPLTPIIFKQIFGKDNVNSPSEISSPPYAVSFCHASLAWSTCTTTEKQVFPGQEFSVPAATTGQYGGISPAIVRTHLSISENMTGQLGPSQNVQDFGREYGELMYLITTTAQHAELHLDIETALELQHKPSVIDIVFLPCPFGFELNTTCSKCDCASHLRAPGVICDINSQTIHRPKSMWIGNHSDDLTLHLNCPFDYCETEGGSISLSYQDTQCSFNRSGVLCGSCLPGLSNCLGSSRCLQCSNTSLLLIVPFALAGLALVFLLLMCNLTVSTGKINGLIFYANIVRKNHSIFFPTGQKTVVTQILEGFIAWLNLDLGIETCFFHGMDTYAKTWLQFIFPVYIWMLAGCIIYSSRYSITISKLMAKNAVPTLGTLFLLSYAKLLHAIIATISPIALVNRDGSISLVWLLDGNIAYLEGAHIALFAMGLLAMMLYIVPFTLLLLLAPCLQARSSHRLLRWVNRLKPLLDAYQGPYKVNFRSWTGFMLLLRVFLFAIFTCNAFGNPQVNLVAIVIIVSGIPTVLYSLNFAVYKRRFVQLLEGFFLSNLVIFAVATFYLTDSKASSRNQEVLADVMVGSAFLVFIIIMGYHFYQQVRETAVVHNLVARCKIRKVGCDHEDDFQNTGSEIAVSRPPNVTVVDLESCVSNEHEMRSFELREPLLTDDGCH